jgi:type II secretory pathway pseudopilin PulG
MSRERGFIVTEIVAVLLIVGTIINIWLPNYIAVKKKAQAARIIGDYLAVRDAATMYHSEYGHWPWSSQWGRAPAGLGMFMPKGFAWDLRPDIDARYSWEYLPITGWDGHETDGVTGLCVFSDDSALIRAVAGIFRGRMVMARGYEGTDRLILIMHMAERVQDG